MSDSAKGFAGFLFIIGIVLLITYIWLGDMRWLRTAAVFGSAALIITGTSLISAKVKSDRDARDKFERLP